MSGAIASVAPTRSAGRVVVVGSGHEGTGPDEMSRRAPESERLRITDGVDSAVADTELQQQIRPRRC